MRGLRLGACLIASIIAVPAFAEDVADACTISLQQLAAAAQTAHAAAAVAAKAATQLDETQALYDQCRLRPKDKKSLKSCQNISSRLKEAERASNSAEDALDAALDEVDAAYDDMASSCEPGAEEGKDPVFTSHRQHGGHSPATRLTRDAQSGRCPLRRARPASPPPASAAKAKVATTQARG